MYEEFVQAKLLLPYPGLYWLPPIGPAAGEAMLKLNMVSAYLVSLGVCTRASTVVLCATFCYLFLQCESNHNNHYILICHATFFASLSDWQRSRSHSACRSTPPAVTVLPSAEIASSTGVEKFASWEFASGISTVADGTIIASSTPARAPVVASRASKPNMAQAVNVPRRCAVLRFERFG